MRKIRRKSKRDKESNERNKLILILLNKKK